MKRFLVFFTAIMLLVLLSSCNGTGAMGTTDDSKQTEENTEPTIDMKNLNIVIDGVSEYVIVRGENASPSEVTAASELQAYLKQISGAELPIVTDSAAPTVKEIVVGKTNREKEGAFDRAELGDDGFVIKTDEGKLWLVGGEQRGTLYSVYEFLEKYLGCRFYTATFEKIPQNATITLDIPNDKQIPVFDTRNSFWYDYFDHDISVKLKLNCSNGRGTIPEELGGSASWASNFCHTLYALAEMTGSRLTEPCITSEDVYNTVLKNVRAALDSNPDARYISISQNDSGANRVGCECDNCMALYNQYGCWTGPYLEFVNKIAREIKDEYPNVMIHTFAYTFTRLVPENLVPEDNVMIQLCTIEACFNHPLESYKENTDEESYNYIDDFAALLKDWSKVCKYLSVWDYTTNFSHYSMTFPNFNVLRENILLFANNNVKSVFEQGNYQSTNGEFSELRGYILARLLWNPYMTEEEYWAMIDEFLVDYYGPGGLKIREYINIALEETQDVHVHLGIAPKDLFKMPKGQTVNPAESYPDELTADMIRNYENVDWTKYWNWFKDAVGGLRIVDEGNRLFAEAMEMAENEDQKARIEKSSIQVSYIESYFMGRRKDFGSNAIAYLIDNYITAHPEEFPDDKENTDLKQKITNFAKSQMLDVCSEFNKALFDKMIKYEIYYVTEAFGISADSELDFKTVPERWKPASW